LRRSTFCVQLFVAKISVTFSTLKHICLIFEIQGKCLPTTPAATPIAVDGAKPAAVSSSEIPKEKAPKEGKTPKTKDASKPKDAAKPKEAKVSQSNQLYVQNALA
jgi:hypothetical protein